ncbi:hypothetical protein NUACC26_034700 [Scytonema sp. NUACC26]
MPCAPTSQVIRLNRQMILTQRKSGLRHTHTTRGSMKVMEFDERKGGG